MAQPEQIIANLDLKRYFKSIVNDYTYTAQNNLVGWFDMTSTNPTDNSDSSSSISSITYRSNKLNTTSDVVLSQEQFNTSDVSNPSYLVSRFNKLNIPNITFSNPRNVLSTYSSSSGPLSFASVSGDLPFSISVWAKLNPLVNFESSPPGTLFEFGTFGQGETYKAVFASTGYLSFTVRRYINGAFLTSSTQLETTAAGIASNYTQWRHYVFTYNGNYSSPVFKIYVDGQLKSSTVSGAGTYTGMAASNVNFFIGANSQESDQWNGFMGQVSVFNIELDQENINAIFEGTAIGSYDDTIIVTPPVSSSQKKSGELSNPSKILSKIIDERVSIVHDCGVRKSSRKKNFNDMNTIDFVERTLVGSIGVENNTTSTPNIVTNNYEDYGIEITHSFGSEFITNQVRNDFNGDSDPFNEYEKIFINDDFTVSKDIGIDNFEQSGFSRNVNQKDIIEIDLKPSEPTTFGIETGVGSLAENDLMVYWNSKDKKWEKIGGTKLKPFSLSSEISRGKVGFAPTAGFIIPSDKNNFKAAFKNYGMHIDNFGFPKHPKYQASNDQYINISDYICRPFVVEKMAYEFDTVLHVDKDTSHGYIQNDLTTNYSQTNHALAYYTFFILNQRDGYLYEDTFKSKTFQLDSSITEIQTVVDEDYQNNLSERDLVGYMQAAVYKDSNQSEDTNYGTFNDSSTTNILGYHEGFLKEGLGRELNISGSNFIESSKSFVDGDYSFSGSMILKGTINEASSHESFGLTFYENGIKTSITDLGAHRDTNFNDKLFPRGFSNSLKINKKNSDNSIKHSLFLGTTTTPNEGKTVKTTYYSNERKPNPYILMPGDKLVLGWQTPVTMTCYKLNDTNGSSRMTINTGVGKLKLYGSFLSNEKVKKAKDIFYQNRHISLPIGKAPLDEYQIFTRKETESNYYSYEFNRPMPNRNAQSKTTTLTGVKSSIHFTSHYDENELIYDSYYPNIDSYLSRKSFTDVANNVIPLNSTNIDIIEKHLNHAPVYTEFESRQKTTNIKFSGMNNGRTIEGLFSKGFDLSGSPSLNDGFTGAKSITYGMYNYKVSKNYSQFNTRHFGYYSDLIQQKRNHVYEIKGRKIYPLEVKFSKNKEPIESHESTSQNIYSHAESYFPFYDSGELTFRTDDITLINTISIDSDMLDVKIKSENDTRQRNEFKNIILK